MHLCKVVQYFWLIGEFTLIISVLINKEIVMKCEVCNDRGWVLTCTECGGKISVSWSDDGDLYETCKHCQGKGIEYGVNQVECPKCKEVDEVKIEFKVVVREIFDEFSKENHVPFRRV